MSEGGGEFSSRNGPAFRDGVELAHGSLVEERCWSACGGHPEGLLAKSQGTWQLGLQ